MAAPDNPDSEHLLQDAYLAGFLPALADPVAVAPVHPLTGDPQLHGSETPAVVHAAESKTAQIPFPDKAHCELTDCGIAVAEPWLLKSAADHIRGWQRGAPGSVLLQLRQGPREVRFRLAVQMSQLSQPQLLRQKRLLRRAPQAVPQPQLRHHQRTIATSARQPGREESPDSRPALRISNAA